MPEVIVENVREIDKADTPVFAELARRIHSIQQKAFDFFEKRGCESGHDLEDWLQAEREVLGSPATEFKDKDSSYEVQIALPGFETKDVHVTATANELLVHATSKQERKPDRDRVVWTEFAAKDLFRRLTLPDAIDPDRTTANLDKGLLLIHAPKRADGHARPLSVRAA